MCKIVIIYLHTLVFCYGLGELCDYGVIPSTKSVTTRFSRLCYLSEVAPLTSFHWQGDNTGSFDKKEAWGTPLRSLSYLWRFLVQLFPTPLVTSNLLH